METNEVCEVAENDANERNYNAEYERQMMLEVEADERRRRDDLFAEVLRWRDARRAWDQITSCLSHDEMQRHTDQRPIILGQIMMTVDTSYLLDSLAVLLVENYELKAALGK